LEADVELKEVVEEEAVEVTWLLLECVDDREEGVYPTPPVGVDFVDLRLVPDEDREVDVRVCP